MMLNGECTVFLNALIMKLPGECMCTVNALETKLPGECITDYVIEWNCVTGACICKCTWYEVTLWMHLYE